MKLDTLKKMMEANAELMETIFEDKNLVPEEKMQVFSSGVKNQLILSRIQHDRVRLLMQAGATGRVNDLDLVMDSAPALTAPTQSLANETNEETGHE